MCVHCCAKFKKRWVGHATLCVLVFVRRIRKFSSNYLTYYKLQMKWKWILSSWITRFDYDYPSDYEGGSKFEHWHWVAADTSNYLRCVALRLHNILQSEIYRKEEPITVDYKFKFPSIQVLITITISIHLPMIYHDIFKIKDSDSECYKLTGCW